MLTANNFFSEMCQQEKSEKDAIRQERLKNDRILKINHKRYLRLQNVYECCVVLNIEFSSMRRFTMSERIHHACYDTSVCFMLCVSSGCFFAYMRGMRRER